MSGYLGPAEFHPHHPLPDYNLDPPEDPLECEGCDCPFEGETCPNCGQLRDLEGDYALELDRREDEVGYEG